MSFQQSIPWPVALQQRSPPLPPPPSSSGPPSTPVRPYFSGERQLSPNSSVSPRRVPQQSVPLIPFLCLTQGLHSKALTPIPIKKCPALEIFLDAHRLLCRQSIQYKPCRSRKMGRSVSRWFRSAHRYRQRPKLSPSKPQRKQLMNQARSSTMLWPAQLLITQSSLLSQVVRR